MVRRIRDLENEVEDNIDFLVVEVILKDTYTSGKVDHSHDIEAIQERKRSHGDFSRTKSIVEEEEIAVGFEDEALTIKNRLIRDQKQLDTISIVGMPGLGKRYLIAMDDVWDTRAWVDLKSLFPNDNNKKVFRIDWCPPELTSIGKKVAIKCQGLPLTIVVKLSRLWVAEGFIRNIWERSLEDVAEEHLMDLIALFTYASSMLWFKHLAKYIPNPIAGLNIRYCLCFLSNYIRFDPHVFLSHCFKLLRVLDVIYIDFLAYPSEIE
ncbi:hypothetical protein TEA_011630 [Camellia sinensis var. sinensis]|uniref:NB-ARC domain-containing protein n=1 Tax=Camellia sinensis var. sinensis TaxID=542762 RepID=A0A4S4CV79_CAMSN|nr:hypothetical protein TEA_011630 [Camellia sinensis var. sinensis]